MSHQCISCSRINEDKIEEEEDLAEEYEPGNRMLLHKSHSKIISCKNPFGGEDGYIGGEDDEEFNKYSEKNVTEEEYNLYSENNVAEGYRVDEEYCTPSQRVEEEDLACTKLVIVEDLAEDGAKKKKIIPMDSMDRMPLYSENNVDEGYEVDEEYCTPSQRVEEEDLACTNLVIVEDLVEDGAKKKKIIPMDNMDRMPLVSAPLYQPKNLITRIRPNKPYGSCTMGSEFKEETKRHKVEGIMEERVEIDELSLGHMMEDYSLYGDMHAKKDTFLTNVLKKWKGEEFFIHEVNGDRLFKLLDTSTWVDDQIVAFYGKLLRE
ncbi:hypothetical protein ACFE04_005584 [Oxalis oulophora]